MTPAALLLTALLAAPAVGGEGVASTALAAADLTRPATLVVRARGLDDVALAGALRPRAGGAGVVLLRDVAGLAPDHTLVDVDLRPPDITITIVLRDGRVFVRRAPAPGGPRDAARLVASMLVAIEGDALAPLPEREATPVLADLAGHLAPASPAPDLPLAVAVPEPAPAVPEPAPVAPPPPRSSEHVRSDMPSRPPSPPAPSGPAPRRLTLDLGLGAAPILGLGVPDTGLRGGGGDVRLELRGDRPWLLAFAVRAAGDRGLPDPAEAGPLGLLRVRLGLGAGTWLRRGRFELRAIAGLSLEPWRVSHDGRPVRADDGGPAPLVGGFVRLDPALAVSARVRLALFAELAASAAPSGRAVEVLVGASRLFSLGGVEASLGLALRVALATWRLRERRSVAAVPP